MCHLRQKNPNISHHSDRYPRIAEDDSFVSAIQYSLNEISGDRNKNQRKGSTEYTPLSHPTSLGLDSNENKKI